LGRQAFAGAKAKRGKEGEGRGRMEGSLRTIEKVLGAENGNHFAVFGVEVKEHTRQEIRATFHRLALQVHPDKLKVNPNLNPNPNPKSSHSPPPSS
jgi:hypothetical protein